MPSDIFIGIDLGTSGARAIAIDDACDVVAEGKSPMSDHGEDHRDPAVWMAAVRAALAQVTGAIDGALVKAISVDGTSGSMLPIDQTGRPLAQAKMYNDACEDSEVLAKIAECAPLESAAHGATSGAAKVLLFQRVTPLAHMVVHQADWVTGQLCGVYASDDNNALKTGYNSITQCWPDWMERAGINRAVLPPVQEPGAVVGRLLPTIAAEFGLSKNTCLVSGTTDGCAAFLATGALEPGDGVTSIGTTLILKILSDKPIFDPASGIYSHRLLGNWLAGGASNSGGGVLLKYFTPDQIAEFSDQIDPTTLLNLGYYPLSQPGERFPIADPDLHPKVSPRPDSDAEFLQALFEGIGHVEKMGYAKLADLGAPVLRSIRTVGGAAKNDVMTNLRLSLLGVPHRTASHAEAAFGTALLAKVGSEKNSNGV